MTQILLPLTLLLVLSQAHGYRFLGCFVDKNVRDLPVLAGTGGMSAGKCNQLCSNRHYKYFGLQYANECWCGNTYGRYGGKPNGQCNMRCTGQRSSMCGAGWRNSIYKTDYAIRSAAPSISASGSSIRSKMAAKIHAMSVHIPGGVVCSTCLVFTLKRQKIGYSSENFPVSELKARLSRYPAKAQGKLRVLQFGANAKTTFEDSHININPNHATKSTYFGIAERINNNVHLGMVSADIVATLVPKYNVYNRRVCRKILFWKRCKNHSIRERRGFHGSEIRQIDTAMQSETMKAFVANLGHIYV